MKLVGLISDTHGLLREEAVAALNGVDLILHAGDVGDPKIVDDLRRIAPVHAVLGNVDRGDWLPHREIIRVEETNVLLLHDIAELGTTNDVDVVVYGHSHKPLVQERDGMLFVNPGSAGRRRFKLPVTVARMQVDGAAVSAEIIQIVEG